LVEEECLNIDRLLKNLLVYEIRFPLLKTRFGRSA
jgi:hypothetical protein